MFGKLQHFVPARHYGFIRVAGRDTDIFFNSAIDFEGDQSLLQRGVLLEFTVRKYKGNDVATEIKIFSAEPEQPEAVRRVVSEVGGNNANQ